MKRLALALCLLSGITASTQSLPEKMAATVMRTWKDSFALDGRAAKWSYDLGVILKGFEGLWRQTGNPVYFDYIRKQIDFFVSDDGTIRGYHTDEYNLDNINNGKLLLFLYKETGREKYLKAAQLLRDQLQSHPRTRQGGFWHKKIYPYQMWLDGLYMAGPFYAEYSKLKQAAADFDDVANQFIWMEENARDAKTGLLHHGWDESRQQKWANAETGKSPLFWARAMGWYADALVDALDWFPANHPKRKALIAILNRLTMAIEKVQDPATGLWLDILAYNGPDRNKNYFEASGACQFVYAVAKGVRLGYLPSSKISIAKKGWDGIQKRFIRDVRGEIHLEGTVKVSGLGGNPYRDGSFAYYMGEPVITDDPKGVGAFLLAGNEMTLLSTPLALQPGSQKLARTVMKIWKDSFALAGEPARWMYHMGVLLKGMEGVWRNSGDARYFQYIQKLVDQFIDEDGVIRGFSIEDYNLDNVNSAKLLLLLYKVTTKEKYLKAAKQVRQQLQTHPRTQEGGLWHKKIYPYQMWLDGLYMAGPFWAEYADLMHEPAAFDDIANQFNWMERHARDAKTGLLYHGWDESRQQQWCNKETGTSPHFWSRGMGWYADALVDVLDWFPRDHPKRQSLINILNRLVAALEKYQDPTTGVWLDILNYNGPGKEKNYFEASASCQFVYAIAKGVRNGYLPASKLVIAQKAYAGILKRFIKEEDGQTNLYFTVKGSGLGGNPYRDGSFDYYMSEPLVVNEPKGMGTFLLASTEMEKLPTLSIGKGKTVVLDRYFNSEKRKDPGGQNNYWHYVWDEYSHPGFAAWGHIFKSQGARLASLDVAPTVAGLRNASVYIIVDPDHVKDNPTPNYVTEKDVAAIRQWVAAGGVLLLMANDSANCDLEHYNLLAGAFGIRFTNKSINMVKNDVFEQGAVLPGEHNRVFPNTRKMYLKEISTLELSFPAEPYVMKDADVIIAGRKYGKGLVVAVGDPWLYNEYLDGRKLPAEYDNFHAASDLAKWLLTRGAKSLK